MIKLKPAQGNTSRTAEHPIVVNEPRVFVNEKSHINVLANHSKITFAAANLSMDILQNNGLLIISGRNLKVRIQSNSGEIINTGIKNEVHIQVETYTGTHEDKGKESTIQVDKKEPEPSLPEEETLDPPVLPFWAATSNLGSHNFQQNEPLLFNSLGVNSTVIGDAMMPRTPQPESLDDRDSPLPEIAVDNINNYSPLSDRKVSGAEDFRRPEGRNPYLEVPEQRSSVPTIGGASTTSADLKHFSSLNVSPRVPLNLIPSGSVITEERGDLISGTSVDTEEIPNYKLANEERSESRLSDRDNLHKIAPKMGSESKGKDDCLRSIRLPIPQEKTSSAVFPQKSSGHHFSHKYNSLIAPTPPSISDSNLFINTNQPTNISVNAGTTTVNGQPGALLTVSKNVGRLEIQGNQLLVAVNDNEGDVVDHGIDNNVVCLNGQPKWNDPIHASKNRSMKITNSKHQGLAPHPPSNKINSSLPPVSPRKKSKGKTVLVTKTSVKYKQQTVLKQKQSNSHSRSRSRRHHTKSPDHIHNGLSVDSRKLSGNKKQQQTQPSKVTKTGVVVFTHTEEVFPQQVSNNKPKVFKGQSSCTSVNARPPSKQLPKAVVGQQMSNPPVRGHSATKTTCNRPPPSKMP